MPKIETPPPQEKVIETSTKKEGFFAKVKQKLFGKKTIVEEEVQKKPEPIPKQIKPRLSVKIKKDKKQHLGTSFMAQSSFISQGITVDAVSDMNLFETFDSVGNWNDLSWEAGKDFRHIKWL